jgi:hypothetical protein
MSARRGVRRLVVGTDDPDEALHVDPVARLKIRQFGRSPAGEIEQTVIDAHIQPRLVVEGEAVADAGGEVLRDLRLEEHVALGTPEEREIGHDGPFGVVVLAQYAIHLVQR